MGISHRKDDIAAQIRRLERDGEAMEDALATVLAFNARVAAGRMAWSWPTIGAAVVTRHHWLTVACEACGTVIDLDLRVKRRDAEVSIRVALREVRCPRCNGSGRPRILALSKFPS